MYTWVRSRRAGGAEERNPPGEASLLRRLYLEQRAFKAWRTSVGGFTWLVSRATWQCRGTTSSPATSSVPSTRYYGRGLLADVGAGARMTQPADAALAATDAGETG